MRLCRGEGGWELQGRLWCSGQRLQLARVLGCDLGRRWSGHVRGSRMNRTKDCKQQRSCLEQEVGESDTVMK